jgi:hypothetical protein
MVELGNYLQGFLQKNEFVHCGNWERSLIEKITYKPLIAERNIHCVYIWLARKQGKIIPLYFGKARNGVFDRMKQHVGGFREDKNGSVSGRRKRNILDKLLSSNWTIEVHAKESSSTGSLDLFSSGLFEFRSREDENIQFPSVSLYSIEEEVLIRFFEVNFPYLILMNGLKDKDANPHEFLNWINSL